MISYFSTNLDGTAGVRERGQRLVSRTTEAARGASGQLRIRAAPSAARAAHGRLRQKSPGLQLSVDGLLRPVLLLLLPTLLLGQLLLLQVQRLLLLVITRRLLPLVFLELDLRPPLFLGLPNQAVLFQLNNKVNN
jgi:hypothetical protein